jgi:hypothetical protein
LESLHRELPVHEIPKISEPFWEFRDSDTGRLRVKGHEIAKGEFVKGPGPSIKEDTWRVVKVSGKGPKDFEPSIEWDCSCCFQKGLGH